MMALHIRNRHHDGYDLTRLAATWPPLSAHVLTGRSKRGPHAATINFKNTEAVEALNAALLSIDYGVQEFQLPRGHLTPAVPGRADYLHVLADLLAHDAPAGEPPHGPAVCGLDVGTGPSCIYPLIGHAEYQWSFLASDVDAAAIASAAALVSANAVPVELRLQRERTSILRGVLGPTDGLVTFTMCNPPFFQSAEEAAAQTARKWRGLRRGGGSTRSFGGSASELWCPGGEKAFITRHIRESARSPKAALWFTSLVSAEKSLPKLEAELRASRASRVEQLGVSTGNKRMRVLAWSFHGDAERRVRFAEAMPS